MSMWEPFEESTRQAIVEAERVSESFGSRVIGNEHLLIGILAAPDSIGGNVLKGFGLTAQGASESLRAMSDARPQPPEGQHVFTDDARKTIEGAFQEARRFDHRGITNAHLILALAAASPKANPIYELGIDAGVLRDRLLAAMNAPVPAQPIFEKAVEIIKKVGIPENGIEKARWFYFNVLGLDSKEIAFKIDPAFEPSDAGLQIRARDRETLVSRIRAANFELAESAGDAYAIAHDPFGNTIDIM